MSFVIRERAVSRAAGDGGPPLSIASAPPLPCPLAPTGSELPTALFPAAFEAVDPDGAFPELVLAVLWPPALPTP
jgi:hypothetical protein